MLSMPFHRCGFVVLVGIGLCATGCDSSKSGENAPAPSKAGSSHKTVMPKDPDKLPADAPMKDVILGRWVSEDADTFTWHFTADGAFVVRSTDPSDLTRFPKELQNKVDAFFGNWALKDSEIVLTAVSGQGQRNALDLSVPYKRISNQEIEIDGAKFTRKAIVPDEPANSDDTDANG